jgi:hypothetical protein
MLNPHSTGILLAASRPSYESVAYDHQIMASKKFNVDEYGSSIFMCISVAEIKLLRRR